MREIYRTEAKSLGGDPFTCWFRYHRRKCHGYCDVVCKAATNCYLALISRYFCAPPRNLRGFWLSHNYRLQMEAAHSTIMNWLRWSADQNRHHLPHRILLPLQPPTHEMLIAKVGSILHKPKELEKHKVYLANLQRMNHYLSTVELKDMALMKKMLTAFQMPIFSIYLFFCWMHIFAS